MNLNPVTTLMLIWLLFGLAMWMGALIVARYWERRNQLLFLRTTLRQSLERGRDRMPQLAPIAITLNNSRAVRRIGRVEQPQDNWPSRQQRPAAYKPLLLPDASRAR